MPLNFYGADVGFSVLCDTPIGRITISHEKTWEQNKPQPKFCVNLPGGRRLKARADTAEELFPVVKSYLARVASEILREIGRYDVS